MSRNRLFASRCLCGIFMLACVLFAIAPAQAQTDVNVDMYETFPTSASKPPGLSGGVVVDPGVNQTADPSLGFLAGMRHMFHPHFGLEVNFGYNRATQHFSGAPDATGPVYSHAKSLMFDYVASLKTYKGFNIFVLGGAGFVSYNISSFTSLPAIPEYMPTGSYGVGADYRPRAFPSFMGLRLQYRALVEHAPDYRLTYLSTNNLINISEPTVGIYFKF